MARSQSNTVIKVLGAGAAVIAGGAALGYLFGGAHPTHPAEQTSQPPVSATLAPAPKINLSLIHPHLANGNYTAPGAPRIVIEEQSQPILRRVSPPPAPAADPEATQEATVPVPQATAPAASGGATAPPGAAPSAPASETSPSTPVPAAASPPSPPPAPADPDFEHVNGGPASNPDPESGQQGGDKTQTGKPQNGKSQTDSGRAQFRVQTGAYTDESSARSIADTLRSQGFSASTHSERDGDHLVYKVQVGAYRSKDGASKAAGDLQKKGYPAFIAPMTP